METFAPLSWFATAWVEWHTLAVYSPSHVHHVMAGRQTELAGQPDEPPTNTPSFSVGEILGSPGHRAFPLSAAAERQVCR